MNPDFDCNRFDEGIISDSVTRVNPYVLDVTLTTWEKLIAACTPE